MRMHRIFALGLALALAGGLGDPRDAAACEFAGLYLGTGPQLPLGCPLHVYAMPGPFEQFPPRLSALRGGSYVIISTAVTESMTELEIVQTFVNCPSGTPVMNRTSVPVPHFAIVPQSVSVGEEIGVDTGWLAGIRIVPAGACPPPVLPTPSCTDSSPPCFFDKPPFEDVETQGCAAGGGSPGGLALLGVAALVRWAPRRRRRR